jgi:beta-glucosidase
MRPNPMLLAAALAALAVLPLPAQQPMPCNCGDPVILVTGDLDYHRLPAGLTVEGADHPEVYAVQASGRFMEAVVPGLPTGRYTVEIDAAETVCRGRGERLMDIEFGRTVIAQDVDLIKRSGGFAQACTIEATVDYPPDFPDHAFSLRFIGRKNDAVFNAIRVKDADGKLVASITAADLLAQEPAGAERIPVVTTPPIYRDPTQPRAKRIDDLISRMSLREKVAQMLNAAPAIPRLGVPAYNYWSEALHGVARAGTATSFPQAIGMAAMWDAPLLHRIADAIATEARAKYSDAIAHGIHAQNYGLTFWSPNINLFRDPRWGRGQETYGEDPFLTGRLAVAFITGLQGDDPHYAKALACAKHFAVHSGPEPLRHTFNVDPTEQDLYDTYLPQFEAAVREGHVGAVMSAYNCVYGKSATASPFLLTEILRRRWGFTGHVVSDCDAVSDIWRTHKLVATPEEAAALAVKAGCDLNCGSQYYALTRAIKQGLLTEQDIDRALHYIFVARFELGMFDPPSMVPYTNIPMSEVDSPAHAALALRAAEESIVLLKNTGVLPLDRARLKRIAVIGANADSVRMLLGNYNGTPSHPVTVLEGIKAVAGPGIEVTYSRGCPLALHPGETYGAEAPDFVAAVAAARAADAVIYVGGISAQLEGEEMRVDYVGFKGGDRTAIELPAPQLELLQALAATGKPVVFVNCSGSAIAMPWAAANLPAIVQAWYPGQAGGTAVAHVLFGDCDPAGRLPVTFYRATSDLPPFVSYAMADRTYRFFTGRPLFAFGHGLSYTTFRYGPVTVAPADAAPTDTIRLRVEVTNTGGRAGDEVVQVYARRPAITDPTLPRVRLCGFRRVSVPQGGQATVEIDIPVSALRRWNHATQTYVVDPGACELQVGAASDDIRGAVTVQIKPGALPPASQL